MISRGTEQIEGSIFTTQLEIKNVQIGYLGGAMVQVKRGSGKGEISELKFIFEDDSGGGNLANIGSGAQFYIGALSPTNNHFFNGSIDNVMIFDKALTQNEITAIYNNQYRE